ncbi:FeoB-associated Cys-rich membrane protein [Pontibacter sp. 172403-2]|uniref:FeoB-associated Cys-rich membrane protein n=1 Tax=Pontibacter rufus TaxID=2791028 RepID=UPI0018AF8D75|nr:FeoB-associated Cys-rich membrane protein [Pontibacter sp. 172403-2]MBF9253061.1 FeoB-associated Cys-rich membrane protein [Pontibacter sp. 172403-2]
MVQQIIILLVFIAALAYIGRMLYRNFTVKGGCASGCSGCSAIDFKKIQKDLEKKRMQVNG